MESLAVDCALVKKLKQGVKDLKRKRTPGLAMSNWCMMTALCIACILNSDFVAVADWLKSSKRRRAYVADDMELPASERLLEQKILNMDSDVLRSWIDLATSTFSRSILKTAMLFAKGHRLANWARDKNVIVGCVVRTEKLIDQYNASVVEDIACIEVLQQAHRHTSSLGRKWVQRWRAKHGGDVGKLRARDPIIQNEIRDKAC